MDQYIGKLLNDRYEIIDVLGVGGMAVVYKAKCHRLNRMVAVKILKPALAADAEIRSRFHDESKAVGMMSHPNIVNVFDVNQDQDIDYFVMELVDGITLKQYIKKRGGVLNWREALHFSAQIMQALGHAHSRGIIHRDIKPQNIMVLRDGSVKVADFGIARVMDSQQTMTQEALGSVHYISPEQAKGSDIDARSDIYSAGVVLYEMLTGRLPYEGDSPVAVAVQHINSIPLAPRELNPEIPMGMEQITMKAMAQKRELRYENAEAMLEDLEAFRRDPNLVFAYQNPWMLTELKEVVPFDQDVKPVESQSDPQEEEEEEQKAGKRTIVLIIGVVLAILLVIALIFRMLWTTFFYNIFDSGEEYSVPDLLGLTITEASEKIFTDSTLNSHFTVSQSSEAAYNAAYKPGQIISQDPEGGTTTKSENTEIVVVVCSEPEEEAADLIMPNIVGEDYESWASTLSEDYNVTVKYNPQYSSDVDEGLVISTEPEAGATLTAGQTVTLCYSRGAKETTVNMISLIGMSENKAKQSLTEMGLEPGTVVTVTSDEKAGTVVFQSVKTGEEVELGTQVNLQVSTGPQPEDEPEEPEEPEDWPENQVLPEEPEEGEDEPENQVLPEEEEHTIVVSMPVNRTASSNVSIKVNGVNYYSGTVAANESLFSVRYVGTIESIDVTVDGESYKDFKII